MATKNPRLMTMLERSLFERVKRAARADGLSLSAKARQLVSEALELEEEAHWSAEGESRLASFRRSSARGNDEVWSRGARPTAGKRRGK
jgi:hypothetical protein